MSQVEDTSIKESYLMNIKNVIKRNGETQPFELSKLEGWAKYAAKVDIEWLPLLINALGDLEGETVKTTDIMQSMIDACTGVGDEAHLKVAARLMRGNIYNMVYGKSSPEPFSASYQNLVAKGAWKDYGLSAFDLVRLDGVFDPLMDKELEYAALCQFQDKYGLGTGHGHSRILVETPQLALMGIAIDIFYDDSLDHVINFYNIIKKRQINIATPIMASSRTGVNGSASCFVYTSGDTLDSIAAGDHLAYLMSANRAGIGTEYDIRSYNDPVAKGKCLHAGKIPHFKALQAKIETAKQGVRAGAATVTFNVMDPELDDLLRMKHPTTDETKRFPKMDFSLAHNMDFLKRAAKGTDWLLVSRVDAPELYRAFYYDRKAFPALMDLALESGIGKRVKARDIFKLYLRQWQETGRMYSVNIDHMNSHTPFKDVIRISNLCVAPETQILTDTGYHEIVSLEGQTVNVWNGEEWSETVVHKTGTDQELLTVTTDSGHSLDCTAYHKFYIHKGTSSKVTMVHASELSVGDRLIKFDLPTIEGSIVLDKAWQNGFFSGDGCVVNGKSRIYLYGDKRNLIDKFDLSVVTSQPEYSRIYGLEDGLQDKFFVPDSSYSIKSRLDWLAGYADADGCIYRNGSNQQLVISSVSREFLGEVQLMLQGIGVNPKIRDLLEEGPQSLPANNGTDETKEYICKKAYRLIITSNQLLSLSKLGLELHRLKYDPIEPNRDASHFVRIASVENKGRVDDTYCFTESKRGMGVFNGILTGQCQEIALPTVPFLSVQELYDEPDVDNGLVGLCFLLAIDVAKTPREDYANVAYYAARALDNIIDKMYYPLENLKSGQKFRSIGIGVTNLAYYLAREGFNYTSRESHTEMHRMAELHQHSLYRASIELAKERGAFEWYDRTKYGDGKLCIDSYNKNIDQYHDAELELDWASLYEDMSKYGMRFSTLSAHMPCESSSMYGYSTNGLYPARGLRVIKSRPEGLAPFPVPEMERLRGRYQLAWDISQIDMYTCYGIWQKFTCQGISADSYLDKAKYPDQRVPSSVLMKNFLHGAKIGVKTNYYFNTDGVSKSDEPTVVPEAACESCDV